MAATTSPLNRSLLAGMIDYTLLRQDTTRDDIVTLCADATELGTGAVCVPPTYVSAAVELLDADVIVATVAGFPSGLHERSVKAREVAVAVNSGADEIDVVANVGLIKAANWSDVAAELQMVRYSAPHAPLKLICESALLTDAELVRVCQEAELAGFEFVKTSTGFSPAGGASAHAVSLMASSTSEAVQVKASGGIRTLAQVQELYQAGATRFGLSAARTILDSFDQPVSVQPVSDLSLELPSESGY